MYLPGLPVEGCAMHQNDRHNCRLPVQVECPEKQQDWHGFTKDIGHDGIFISRANCFMIDSHVTLHIIDHDEVLDLDGEVTFVNQFGTDIRFHGLSNKQRAYLDRILHPEWQTGEILDDLLVVARHGSMRSLADCFRTTTLIEQNRKHKVSGE